jgi:hypothetical protein
MASINGMSSVVQHHFNGSECNHQIQQQMKSSIYPEEVNAPII